MSDRNLKKAINFQKKRSVRMSFKILIVEDEDLFADQLEMLIDKLGYEHLGTADNSVDALASVDEVVPDLILMDVHINGEHDGIELAEIIQKQLPIPIIFMTSLKDDLTFRRASRVGPLNFLVKPFDQLQLQRTIELTVRKLTDLPSGPKVKLSSIENGQWNGDFFFRDHFFIKSRNHLEKVAVEDVLFLEADGHYCKVHTSNRKFLVHQTLTDLSERLPSEKFINTHRAYLVNFAKISSVDVHENLVKLGECEVPLSRRSKTTRLARLNWV